MFSRPYANAFDAASFHEQLATGTATDFIASPVQRTIVFLDPARNLQMELFFLKSA
jgi:hypothetical protein